MEGNKDLNAIQYFPSNIKHALLLPVLLQDFFCFPKTLHFQISFLYTDYIFFPLRKKSLETLALPMVWHHQAYD